MTAAVARVAPVGRASGAQRRRRVVRDGGRCGRVAPVVVRRRPWVGRGGGAAEGWVRLRRLSASPSVASRWRSRRASGQERQRTRRSTISVWPSRIFIILHPGCPWPSQRAGVRKRVTITNGCRTKVGCNHDSRIRALGQEVPVGTFWGQAGCQDNSDSPPDTARQAKHYTFVGNEVCAMGPKIRATNRGLCRNPCW